jgi:hypothetical protein
MTFFTFRLDSGFAFSAGRLVPLRCRLCAFGGGRCAASVCLLPLQMGADAPGKQREGRTVRGWRPAPLRMRCGGKQARVGGENKERLELIDATLRVCPQCRDQRNRCLGSAPVADERKTGTARTLKIPKLRPLRVNSDPFSGERFKPPASSWCGRDGRISQVFQAKNFSRTRYCCLTLATGRKLTR